VTRPSVAVTRLAVLLVVALGAAFVGPSTAAARRSVPYGFFGVQLDQGIYNPRVNLGYEFSRMARTGIESVRFPISWRDVQPYRRFSDIPASQRAAFTNVGGIPMNLTSIDRMMRPAAARRMFIIPVIVATPRWAGRNPADPFSTVRNVGDYARFVKALVGRYGPRGKFFRGYRRARPVRWWQIWNEVGMQIYWPVRPYAQSYVRLLRAGYRAVKSRDRGAKVLLTALASNPNETAWDQLANIYRAGGKRWFDAAALNYYPQNITNLGLGLVAMRNVMAHARDSRKPLLLTEFGWSSASNRLQTPVPWDTTPEGQARELRASFAYLARNRRRLRLLGAWWYTWLNDVPTLNSWGAWTGMRYLAAGPGFAIQDRPLLLDAYRAAARRYQR